VKNANHEFDIPINVVICLLHALCHPQSSKTYIVIYLFCLICGCCKDVTDYYHNVYCTIFPLKFAYI